jgi:hypothetical protein
MKSREKKKRQKIMKKIEDVKVPFELPNEVVLLHLVYEHSEQWIVLFPVSVTLPVLLCEGDKQPNEQE